MISPEQIAANLLHVRRRLETAAAQAGRDSREITLVGVTKYVDAAAARALFEAGLEDLGESRPQELWKKAEALRDLPVRWHLVGRLQRNKVKRTVSLVSLVHSVSSARLLDALQLHASPSEPVHVLLEVNVARESEKDGWPPEEIVAVIDQLDRWPAVRVRGLMAMAPRGGDLDAADACFRELGALLKQCRERPAGEHLSELSMGMSHDLECAVRNGATMVRIGSALFEDHRS